MGARNDHAPREKSKEGTNKLFLKEKRNAPVLRPEQIHGGSASGVLGAGLVFSLRRVH
jgi:hypothetical protein